MLRPNAAGGNNKECVEAQSGGGDGQHQAADQEIQLRGDGHGVPRGRCETDREFQVAALVCVPAAQMQRGYSESDPAWNLDQRRERAAARHDAHLAVQLFI
eukprot:Pompholyxophrys_punicea_v1_NODE_701_length_1433_cov_1.888970.p3 type:complete len:101 gc:universal NODE_701_length_1433_cov_1.888970:331-29(-)